MLWASEAHWDVWVSLWAIYVNKNWLDPTWLLKYKQWLLSHIIHNGLFAWYVNMGYSMSVVNAKYCCKINVFLLYLSFYIVDSWIYAVAMRINLAVIWKYINVGIVYFKNVVEESFNSAIVIAVLWHYTVFCCLIYYCCVSFVMYNFDGIMSMQAQGKSQRNLDDTLFEVSLL